MSRSGYSDDLRVGGRDGTTQPQERDIVAQIEDAFAEVEYTIEHVQSHLMNRKQPQDVVLHRGLKAIRDGRNILTRLRAQPNPREFQQTLKAPEILKASPREVALEKFIEELERERNYKPVTDWAKGYQRAALDIIGRLRALSHAQKGEPG